VDRGDGVDGACGDGRLWRGIHAELHFSFHVSSTSTSTWDTAGSQGSTLVPLPIVHCQTSFAVTPPPTTVPLPISATVSVPTGEAANLFVYSDDAGIMMLIGPADRSRHGLYGADGSGGLLIAPAGESVPSDPDTGWHLPALSSDEAIVGYETGASPVEGAELACPLFPAAAAATRLDLGRGCTVTRPVREIAAGTASREIGFEDPAGVAGDGIPSGGQNPANGVMLFMPAQGKASAYLATCTLPDAQHDVCTAVLDHFIALYG
jgi:hypothetical protein